MKTKRHFQLGLLLISVAVDACAPTAVSDLPADSPANAKAEQLARSVTIYRDTYGVPHVWGPTDASCVFGFAYAQAEDNFPQLEDNYIRALGRASEAHGESQLAEDMLNRALEIPRLSDAEYRRTSPEMRAIADTFAQGLNYFLARNPQVHPRLIRYFKPWYVFAFARYEVYQRFVYGQSGLKPDEIMSTVGKKETAAQRGSNMWAVGPAKSADGHALLFINPHSEFFGPGEFYEGQVHSDQGWDMSGAAFLGSPFPVIGHNRHLGWSATVNYPDIVDLYAEKFDKPEDPLAYRYGNSYRKAVQRTDTIKVQTPTGIQSRTVTFKRTIHGPVISTQNGHQLTIRFAKLVSGGAWAENYAMSRARNLGEFKVALSRLALPMFNYTYADQQGNIFYVYPAAQTVGKGMKPNSGQGQVAGLIDGSN